MEINIIYSKPVVGDNKVHKVTPLEMLVFVYIVKQYTDFLMN